MLRFFLAFSILTVLPLTWKTFTSFSMTFGSLSLILFFCSRGSKSSETEVRTQLMDHDVRTVPNGIKRDRSGTSVKLHP